jgi:hypothetical protein
METAMAEETAAEAVEEGSSPSEEALLGERDVKLSNGSVIYIGPWGVRTGQRMMRRLKFLFEIYQKTRSGGGFDLGEFMFDSYDEIVDMVAGTIGVEIEELYNEDKYLLEDFIALVEAIIRVNFIERPGLRKNLESLLQLLIGTIDQVMPEGAEEELEAPILTPSQEPSSS